MSSTAASFEFVLAPRQGQTTKQRQLQQAIARSHAARVSHPGKKRPKKVSTQRESTPSSAEHPPGPIQGFLKRISLLRPALRSIVDDARSDPFDNNDLRQLSVIGHKSLEYVYTVLWPKNYPAVEGQALKSMQITWRRRALEDLLQFHSQVFNAATMCFTLSTDPKTMQALMDIRLKHQAVAVDLVRQRLLALQGNAPEQLITDIMRLAAQGGSTFRLSRTSPYPKTPVANTFAVKPYGRFEMNLPHFSAFVQLTKQRGGLETLTMSAGHPAQL